MHDKEMNGAEWFTEGQMLLRRGEHEESAGAFTNAIQKGWDPVMSYLSRGVAGFLAGRRDRAFDDFSEVLKRDGQNVRALFYRGSLSLNDHHYARAAADFTRALDIDPDYGEALLNRGVCYAQMGRHEEAATDIKRAVMAAETDAQHFADTLGIWRTHLEGVLGVLHQHTDLTEEEIARLEEFFE